MKQMLGIVAMLLVATFLFHTAINYMADNIGDFENVALPPKKPKVLKSKFSTLKVDATSKKKWALLDFATGKVSTVADISENQEQLGRYAWDLAFQRTKIVSNSGDTHPGGSVEIINLGAKTLDDIKEPPANGYAQDRKKWGALTNEAITDWYVYRTRTHNIESKKNAYVLKTHGDRYVKMRILNYYCHNQEKDCRSAVCSREEAACYTIEYMLLNPGENTFPEPVASKPMTPALN